MPRARPEADLVHATAFGRDLTKPVIHNNGKPAGWLMAR